MLKYLKSLIKSNTGDSIKSFSLLISCLGGSLMSLVVAFSLMWDVIINGHIETDLEGLGWFILCVGGFIAGSGVNKLVADHKSKKQKTNENE